MKKSIYEIYVPVTSQQQADRLKAICVKYGLPIWDYSSAFEVFETDINPVLMYNGYEFFILDLNDSEDDDPILNYTPITESEFLELAKEFKQ